MKYLKIQSQGEIEVEAFTLIGASTKRNDQTKIGFFGSGLKYSIAAMIRNKRDFHVFSGEREIIFSTMNTTFRDNAYDKILVDGKETSLTVTMGGGDWDIPFAPIREIYSNAMDEDESTLLEVSENILGIEGQTIFYIALDEDTNDFFNNRFDYFCTNDPSVIYSNDFGSIFPAKPDKTVLFRKGILCYQNPKKAAFSYNGDFPINESRVLNNTYTASCIVAAILKSCNQVSVISSLVYAIKGGNSGMYEHELAWDTPRAIFTPEWGEFFKTIKCVPAEGVTLFEPEKVAGRFILPLSLLKELARAFEGLDILGLTKHSKDMDFVEAKPSPDLVNKVIESLRELNGTRYQNRFEKNPQISYVKFIDESVLGRALTATGEILLSIKLSSNSISEISKIIIEENEHLVSGYGDKTRAFQDHLFNLYYDELVSVKNIPAAHALLPKMTQEQYLKFQGKYPHNNEYAIKLYCLEEGITDQDFNEGYKYWLEHSQQPL